MGGAQGRPRTPLIATACVAWLLGCHGAGGAPGPGPGDAGADASPWAAEVAEAEPRPGMVWIPSGVLIAGTPRDRLPRVPDEEMAGRAGGDARLLRRRLPVPGRDGRHPHQQRQPGRGARAVRRAGQAPLHRAGAGARLQGPRQPHLRVRRHLQAERVRHRRGALAHPERLQRRLPERVRRPRSPRRRVVVDRQRMEARGGQGRSRSPRAAATASPGSCSVAAPTGAASRPTPAGRTWASAAAPARPTPSR